MAVDGTFEPTLGEFLDDVTDGLVPADVARSLAAARGVGAVLELPEVWTALAFHDAWHAALGWPAARDGAAAFVAASQVRSQSEGPRSAAAALRDALARRAPYLGLLGGKGTKAVDVAVAALEAQLQRLERLGVAGDAGRAQLRVEAARLLRRKLRRRFASALAEDGSDDPDIDRLPQLYLRLRREDPVLQALLHQSRRASKGSDVDPGLHYYDLLRDATAATLVDVQCPLTDRRVFPPTPIDPSTPRTSALEACQRPLLANMWLWRSDLGGVLHLVLDETLGGRGQGGQQRTVSKEGAVRRVAVAPSMAYVLVKALPPRLYSRIAFEVPDGAPAGAGVHELERLLYTIAGKEGAAGAPPVVIAPAAVVEAMHMQTHARALHPAAWVVSDPSPVSIAGRLGTRRLRGGWRDVWWVPSMASGPFSGHEGRPILSMAAAVRKDLLADHLSPQRDHPSIVGRRLFRQFVAARVWSREADRVADREADRVADREDDGRSGALGVVAVIDTRPNWWTALCLLATLDSLRRGAWRVVFFCSDANVYWVVREVLARVDATGAAAAGSEAVVLPELNAGFSLDAYNDLLTSERFWAHSAFGAVDRVLMVQDDGALLRSGLEDDAALMSTGYAGAPWEEGSAQGRLFLGAAGVPVDGPTRLQGNGGVSLRSRRSMLWAVREDAAQGRAWSRALFLGNSIPVPEDVFFAAAMERARARGLLLADGDQEGIDCTDCSDGTLRGAAPRDAALRLSTEQVLPAPVAPPSLGTHKPWPYHPPDGLAERLRLTLGDAVRVGNVDVQV